jgi:GNAT superfamily N-acetyltransferase
MDIRPALENEAQLLCALAMKAKAYWGYTKDALEAWRSDLTVSAKDIRAKPTYVATVDGEIVGFYSLEPSRQSWKLDNLWVLPEYMNQGIGRVLLDHALEAAVRGGAVEVTVDADPNAASFYIQCGAIRRGEVAAPIPEHPTRVRPQLAFNCRAT